MQKIGLDYHIVLHFYFGDSIIYMNMKDCKNVKRLKKCLAEKQSFYITYTLEAGKTYLLAAKFENKEIKRVF